MIRNEGMVNSLLMWLGIIDQPLQIMFTDFAIMLGMVYVYLPLMVLPLYASLEKLDFRLVEAGYDLYANRLKVLWRIILPLVQARHHRRFDPRLHSLARRLCHAARAGRRQEPDDRQSHRTAVRPGPQLAARFGAVDHADGAS